MTHFNRYVIACTKYCYWDFFLLACSFLVTPGSIGGLRLTFLGLTLAVHRPYAELGTKVGSAAWKESTLASLLSGPLLDFLILSQRFMNYF